MSQREERSAATTLRVIGPAEPWFCECDEWGWNGKERVPGKVLRTTRVIACPVCHAVAPWAEKVESAATASGCPDCGWSFASCECYDDDPEGDDDFACTFCGGEGTCEAGCDPGWYDDIHACHACNGTGRRRDQVIF